MPDVLKDNQSTVKSLHIPCPNKNHDGFAYSNKNFIVLDGATPLRNEDQEDLKLWVDYMAKEILNFSEDCNIRITEAWHKSILNANQKYEPKGIFRSAGISHARIQSKKIEYLIAGDVKLFIKQKNGACLEVFDDRLDYHEKVADSMIAIGEITPIEAAIINRNKVNKPEGYYVLSDDPYMPSKALYGCMELSDVESIIIATDGMWRLLESDLDASNMFQHDLFNDWSHDVVLEDDLTVLKVDFS